MNNFKKEPFTTKDNGCVYICGYDIPIAKGDEKKFIEYLKYRCDDDTPKEIIDDIFRIGCAYLYGDWKKNKYPR